MPSFCRRASLRLVAVLAALSASVGDARQEDVVLSPVTVLSMVEGSADLRPEQAVWIRGEVIVQVGPSERILERARAESAALTVVDGRGGTVLPGLVDAHVHVQHEGDLLSLLAHGVTTVFHLGAPTSAHASLLRWRREIASGQRLGPTLYVAGPSLDGPRPAHPAWSRATASVEEVSSAVAEQAKRGFDLVKIYSRLERETYDAVASEAAKFGLTTVGHIPRHLGIETVTQLRQQMVAHGEEFFFTMLDGPRDGEPVDGWSVASARLERIARACAERGIVVTPNLSFIAAHLALLEREEPVPDDPEVAFLHPLVRQQWRFARLGETRDSRWLRAREVLKLEAVRDLTLAMDEAGVLLLLGTDTPLAGLFPGASAHLELRELMASGLSARRALAAATYNAGVFVREHVDADARIGTVSAGSRADLLLVAGNPLGDISVLERPRGVMARGRWLPAEELDELRSQHRARLREAQERLGAIVAMTRRDAPPSVRELRRASRAALRKLDWAERWMVQEINARALALASRGQLERAISWIEAAIQVLPHSASLHYSLGEGHRLRAAQLEGAARAATLERARSSYRRADDLGSGTTEGGLARARLREMRGAGGSEGALPP